VLKNYFQLYRFRLEEKKLAEKLLGRVLQGTVFLNQENIYFILKKVYQSKVQF